MAPRVDFTGVSDGFEPIPEGTYEATLTKSTFIEKSKSSGRPAVRLEYTITEEPYNGRKVFTTRSLVPEALFGLKGDLKALGMSDDDLGAEFDTDDIENLYGAECRVEVEVRDYEGKPVNNLKRVLAPEFAF